MKKLKDLLIVFAVHPARDDDVHATRLCDLDNLVLLIRPNEVLSSMTDPLVLKEAVHTLG